MKTFLLNLMFLTAITSLPKTAMAQSRMSIVKLKSGTEIKGVIKHIDPTDAVTLEIAGIETKIKMDQIQLIEEVTAAAQNSNTPDEQSLIGKLRVTDTAEYPDSIHLKIGSENMKLILVRGGDLNMGYDGPYSRKMDSEPIHKVYVSSFYISEKYVSVETIRGLNISKSELEEKEHYFKTGDWGKANAIVSRITQITSLPVRLPTEAEWEFAACSKEKDIIFKECIGNEFCSDYFGKFEDFVSIDNAIDPQGPDYGTFHVVRNYDAKMGKYDRSPKTQINDRDKLENLPSYIRLALSAKEVVKK